MGTWLVWQPELGESVALAQMAEQAGFEGLLLFDSQCLAADSMTELARISQATSRLRFGTCATNVVTRHPALLASAAMTLQIESGSRMVLTVARGDTAVSKLGMPPLSVADFGQALSTLRALAAGRTDAWAGHDCHLAWLPPDAAPVPVWAAASGPRTIAAGSANADGIVIQVGAEPDVVARVVAAARRAAGDPEDFRVAAYLVVGVHDDPEVAAGMVEGMALTASRMAARTLRTLDSPLSQAATEADSNYSVALHGRAQGSSELSRTALVKGYAIAGDAAYCSERLQAVLEAGVDHLVLLPGSLDTPKALREACLRLLANDVLPHLPSGGAPAGPGGFQGSGLDRSK